MCVHNSCTTRYNFFFCILKKTLRPVVSYISQMEMYRVSCTYLANGEIYNRFCTIVMLNVRLFLLPRLGWRNGLQIWRVAANMLNMQSRVADKRWSSSLRGVRVDNNSSPLKINHVMKYCKKHRIHTDPSVQPKQ
jgi:hypothetical protein